jgi:hypothetical protein
MERMGEQIFKALGRDNSNYYSNIIMQASQDKRRDMPLRERAIEYACALVLKICEDADPTPTNSYVMWIISRWIKGGIYQLEDIRSTVADALDEYDEIKRGGYFRRSTTDPVMKKAGDINTLKSLYELRSVIRSVPLEDRVSNTAADKARAEEILKNEARLVLDTPTVRVVVPTTEAASCYFGRNTQWCTAAKRNNAFDSYNRRGELFIVLDKANNRRWQFHPGTASFMDENDEELGLNGWNEVPKEALQPELYAGAFDEMDDDRAQTLTDIVVMQVSPFSELAHDRLEIIGDR